MSELRRGDDPNPVKPGRRSPKEDGQYVIEILGFKPSLCEVVVEDGIPSVLVPGLIAWHKWDRLKVVRYRKWDALSYLEAGATP